MSVKRAIIMIGGGTSALPIRRSFFRPFLSENIPRGIERRTIAPSRPRRSPTMPALMFSSGKKPVR